MSTYSVRGPHAALLDGLRAELAAVASVRAGVALGIQGRPGAGKTWSTGTLLAALPFRGTTVRAGAAGVELSRAVAHADAPAWAIASLGADELPETGAVAARAEALAALLARRAPFVLVVEDLHEAPRRTPFWRAVAEAVARTRGVACIVTGRSGVGEVVPRDRVHELRPLSAQEVARLLEGELGAPLPARALAWIAARSDGNPLFALEHVRFLARRGNLWSDGVRWRWRPPDDGTVPTSLQALVAERLRLAARDASSRGVLLARALLPEDAEETARATVAGVDASTLRRIEHELLRAGIVHGGGFAHPLFRETVLREARPDDRRPLARRALRALAARPDLAAGLVEPAGLSSPEAFERLRHAAGALRERGDPEGAARAMAHARLHVEGGARVATTLAAAGALRSHDLPAARALLEEVLRERPGHVDATFLLAEILALDGEGEEAERILERLPDGDALLERRWSRIVTLRAERADFVGAVAAWHDRPEAHATVDASLVRAVAFAKLHLGAFAEADALVARFLARHDPTGLERARLLHVRAGVRYHQGAYEEAAAAWATVARLLDGGEEAHLLGRALGNRGAALSALHRIDEAIADVEAALAVFERIGAGRDHARQLHNHGGLLRQRGAFEEAEEELLEARAVFERADDRAYLVACDVDLVVLYLDWQPPYAAELALRAAGSGLENARRLGSATMTTQALRAAARAEARHGDVERALALVDECLAVARGIGRVSAIASGTWTRGHVLEAAGRHEAALAAFREAVALQEAEGRTVRAQIDALEVDRLLGDVEAARRRERFFREHGSHEGLRSLHRAFPDLLRPDVRPPPSATPCLRVLGPFVAERAGERIVLRGRKGRELLARLLAARLAGREGTGQLELQDALYPGVDDRRAAAALQQLVHRLRESLGPRAILRTADGYALGDVESDAETFLRGGPASLWRGRVVSDVDEGDPNAAARLSAALRARVEELLDADPVEAPRLADLLTEREPYDRDVLRLAVRAAASDAAARRVYEAGRARLREVGEALPPTRRAFLTP